MILLSILWIILVTTGIAVRVLWSMFSLWKEQSIQVEFCFLKYIYPDVNIASWSFVQLEYNLSSSL